MTMTYLEFALVLLIALCVLGPKELQACALLVAKAWRSVQSTKALLTAQLLQAEAALKTPAPKDDDQHHG